MQTHYDIIVIGGGPGGAVCARELALMGHSVIVIEKSPQNAFKPSAGAISSRNFTITPMQEDIIERVIDSGFFCTASGNTYTISADDDVAYMVSRVKFDNCLQSLATAAGAVFLHEAEVTAITITSESVTVDITSPDGDCQITASAVAGAFGGGNAPLYEMLGCEMPPLMDLILTELSLPAGQIDQQFGNSVESYMDTARITPAGRAWIYPKTGTVSAGITSAARFDEQTLRAKLLDFIDHHPVASKKLAGYVPCNGTLADSTFRRSLPMKPVAKSFGDRFLLIGDAAGAGDPLTGEGVYHAQRTGHIASVVLHKAIDTGDFSAEHLADYEKRWHRSLLHYDTDYNRKSAEILFNAPNADLVMETLLQVAEGNPKVREAVLWVFTGLRTQREAMLHAASPRLILDMVARLSIKAVPLIPRILKTYKLSDLL